MIRQREVDVRFLGVTLLLLVSWLATALHAAPDGQSPITFKIVKKAAGMTTAPPTVRLLSAAEQWTLRDARTWTGQNEREIFFTLTPASADASLPEVAVTAAGVEPVRVIVGKSDVPFTRQGDQVRFTLVRDTRNAMLLDQVLHDSEGGLPSAKKESPR